MLVPEANVEGLGIAISILADDVLQPVQIGGRAKTTVHLCCGVFESFALHRKKRNRRTRNLHLKKAWRGSDLWCPSYPQP